ncbi:MAG: peptidylprolyl isomerase [Desulfuromonadales bacterium]|nr:peptidylprolyl isomerase [Desulfuromonadales bacterium]
MNRAQEGDTVTVTFQGLLEDGSVFDSSEENDPLTFILGENEVLPGFELAVIGMEVGDQKTVTLPPEDGYGVRQEHLVEEVEKKALPNGLNLSVGSQLEVTAEDGAIFQLIVIKQKQHSVVLDANHPLAGRSLIFHIEVLSIDQPTIN